MRGVMALAVLLGLAACSGEQVYNSAQGWRENECNKLLDPARQQACLEQARKPYDDYRKEKDAAK